MLTMMDYQYILRIALPSDCREAALKLALSHRCFRTSVKYITRPADLQAFLSSSSHIAEAS